MLFRPNDIGLAITALQVLYLRLRDNALQDWCDACRIRDTQGKLICRESYSLATSPGKSWQRRGKRNNWQAPQWRHHCGQSFSSGGVTSS